jgi:SpoIID/LytB domain protein
VVKNIIKEPLIRIGIILPEDKKTVIRIQIPNQSKYLINNKIFSGSLKIESRIDSLFIKGDKHKDIIISPISDNTNKYLIIDSVSAGRGFHWQKNIETKLPGKIIIKNSDGYIFLINELPLEQYLPYVATAEMNADCPTALLEAQTIAARSWLLANRKANHPELDIDACNDDCCQRYQGVVDVPNQSLQAIKNTFGQVIFYDNQICNARYSKSCGGISESSENVWGGEPIPYLSSIADFPSKNIKMDDLLNFINSFPPAFCSEKYVKPSDVQQYLGKVDKSGSYYRWEITYSQDKMTSIINQKLELNATEIINILPLNRGLSGRIIRLKIDYINKSNTEKSIILNNEYDIRNALHKQFLYSSAVTIEQKLDENRNIKSFKFNGAGWGHGVGLCQIGALGMALHGYSSEDILKHYFKNSIIKKIY